MQELQQLSKKLLAANKKAQDAFLKSLLSMEGKYWSEFYKYLKRRKGNRENIPAIKDSYERIITDSIDKANSFNSYYLTVFSNEGNIPHMQGENTGEPFTIDINPYPTAFPYGNGMVLHFYQQQESSTTKTVHKVINKGLKTYV